MMLSSSTPACLACMRSINSASSASRHGCSRPAAISAAPGIGIATPGPGSILRVIPTYSFSQELIDEWEWSEHFSGQPEIERYLHFVAEKFALTRDIECNARVATVIYDEANKQWEIETHNGLRARARYVICATGLLSAHQLPPYAGVADFAGLSLHSARWPKDPTGKRVGIIGTGPTGVQIIQSIAPDC